MLYAFVATIRSLRSINIFIKAVSENIDFTNVVFYLNFTTFMASSKNSKEQTCAYLSQI